MVKIFRGKGRRGRKGGRRREGRTGRAWTKMRLTRQPPLCICSVDHQSYKTDDRDREYNYSLKSYLNSVLNVTLVHVPHWSGVVPPWSVMVLH